MYLRSTKRKNKDGSSVAYYQLAHNQRHPVTRKPVAKIIHNFGRADQLDHQQLVRLCKSIVGDGERRKRYILCYNPKEAERQRKHRQMTVALLEKELDRHKHKSATAQWAIELLASRRFKRYLRILKSGEVRIDRAAIRDAEKFDGKWVIQTNDDTISLEDAVYFQR